MMQGLLIPDMQSFRMHQRYTKQLRTLVLVLVLLLIPVVILDHGVTSRLKQRNRRDWALFAQEDFDVDATGTSTIAALGVDNTQLQNNRIGFADGNSVENFELDQELTATTGYRGFNYLNYVKVNDTSGNLLFGANNTGDSGAGEIDVNVRSYFSDPDITLDGAVAQTLDKTGDGNLTFQLTQNSASARNLSILSTNAGLAQAQLQSLQKMLLISMHLLQLVKSM